MKHLIIELTQTELLKDTPNAIVESILANQSVIELQAGEILLSPEHDNYHIYLVLSGAFGLHFGSLNSPEIRTLKQGNCVGEMSVIDPSKPSAYVIAKETCRVFPIHRNTIQKYVTDANPIIRNLLKVLTHWIRVNTEYMDKNNSKIGELTTYVSTDVLTGLYNRRWLDTTLEHLLYDAIETSRSLCILLIDVDKFKHYNDTFGHIAGDQALAELGNTLKNTIRPEDFASRYGGEEFLILLPNTHITEGALVAERIRHIIESKAITASDGSALPSVTASIGLAVNTNTSTTKSLIDLADAKLYEAKQQGRNCVCF